MDNQRSTFEIFDNETIDEIADPGTDAAGSYENLMDLGGTEKETATISDFDLLKVIGKGSFGKVCCESEHCVCRTGPPVLRILHVKYLTW